MLVLRTERRHGEKHDKQSTYNVTFTENSRNHCCPGKSNRYSIHWACVSSLS